MTPKLKTVHEAVEETSDPYHELEAEDESGEDTESDNETDMVPKQLLVSKKLKKFLWRFLKGFGSGLGVYSGIKLVTTLMRNPFRDRLVPRMQEIAILAKDSIRFAAFLGLYPSVYALTLDFLEYFRGRRNDWNSSLAGGIAGLAMVVEDRTRRRIYCLFAITRAFGALVSTLVRREVLPNIPYLETYLFGACSSFLVYCTALKPQYLQTGYYNSVLKWSRDYTDKKLSKLFREPNTAFLTCADVGLHSGSCEKHALVDFLQSLPAFAKLYLPIHIAPFIFFRRRVLLKRPKRAIKSLIRNVLWSTAFLATLTLTPKYTLCLLRRLQHRPSPLSWWIPALAGFTAALGLLFERVNRRKELLLFVMPHTFYGIYLSAKTNGLVRHIPYSSVFLFALSMVPIMHAYEREPESLSLLVHSALKFFVGRRQSTVERQRLRRLSEMST